MKRYLLLSGLCGLLIAVPAFSAEKGSETRFSSMRQLGMGGAGVAITYDEHALYKNPAGLNKAKTDFNLPRIRVGVDEQLLDDQSDVQTLLKGDSSDDEARDLLSDLVPIEAGAMLSMSPLMSFTTKGFGLGIFTQSDMLVQIVNKVSPEVRLDLVSDASFLIGGAVEGLPWVSKKLITGISVGYIARGRIYETLDYSDFAEDGEIELESTSATGLNLNLGFLYPVKIKSQEMMIGVAINNIGSTLTGIEESDEDTEIPLTSTIGVGMDVKLPLIGKTTLAADYKVVSEESNAVLNLSLGAEKKLFNRFLTLRGGINDGYVVGGLDLDFWLFKLGYAFHTDEAGGFPGDRPISQHVVQFSFGI